MHEQNEMEAFCLEAGCNRPAFPSPPSCLPEEEQAELEERIEEANRLLLDLALSNEQPLEGRRISFEGLIGQWVELTVVREIEPAAAEKEPSQQTEKKKQTTAKKKSRKRKKIKNTRSQKKRVVRKRRAAKPVLRKRKKSRPKKAGSSLIKLSGRVHLVGRNFVLLKKKEYDLIVPFSKVRSVKTINRYRKRTKQPALLTIDPCLRQSLMFNFGETVSSSPELVQLFFRMTLPVFLLYLLDKKVKILLPGKKISGFLHDADQESLTVRTASEKKITIPFPSFYCLILYR